MEDKNELSYNINEIMKNLLNLPAELRYNIVDMVHNEEIDNKGEMELYKTLNLQLPKNFFKSLFFDVVWELYSKFCYDCEKFIPFPKQKFVYNIDMMCFNNICGEYLRCDTCYLEKVVKGKYGKVLKECFNKHCKNCYEWQPLKVCRRCKKVKSVQLLLEECLDLADSNKESWLRSHTIYIKFIDRIIVERTPKTKKLIGFLILLKDGRDYDIYFTMISKRHRKKGVLKKMVLQLPNEDIYLEYNSEALKIMYMKLGWEPIYRDGDDLAVIAYENRRVNYGGGLMIRRCNLILE